MPFCLHGDMCHNVLYLPSLSHHLGTTNLCSVKPCGPINVLRVNLRAGDRRMHQTLQTSGLYGDYKVKCSHYRPGVAQRVASGIALLFHDRGTRSG